MRRHLIAAALMFCTTLSVDAHAATPLPDLPNEPQFDTGKYPACQKDWITTAGADRNAKSQLIVRCVRQLETFNQIYLKHFTQSVASYSRQLTLLDARYHHSPATAAEIHAFSQIVQNHLDRFRSINAQGDFGDGYQGYYDCLYSYQADVQSLTDAWKNLNT